MTSDLIVIDPRKIDDDALERLTAELPRERVVEQLYLITDMRRSLYRAEQMLKSRIVGESILSVGETWTAPDKSEWFWGGDRSRECSDPAALREQLAELPLNAMGKIALRAAFKEQPMKVYLTELDKIEHWGGPEAGKIIRSFVDWRESAPKLRPRDMK